MSQSKVDYFNKTNKLFLLVWLLCYCCDKVVIVFIYLYLMYTFSILVVYLF